jgi:hypothetical protein
MGLSDVDELAPLAYQARMAAKKYARERSRLPGRIGSMVYDGWRQWRRYGKWKFDGMTWEQIWDKYENQILRETVGGEWDGEDERSDDVIMQGSQLGELNDKDLTAKICLRILERSVVTNEMIDKLFLERLYGKRKEDEESEDDDSLVDSTPLGRKQRRQERRRQRTQQIQSDLKAIEKKFDEDIRELLRHGGLTTEEGDSRRKNRNGNSFFWSNDELSSHETDGTDAHESTLLLARGGGEDDPISDQAMFSSITDAHLDAGDMIANSEGSVINKSTVRKLAIHEVSALRILASTRRRIASLQASPDDSIPPKQ